MRCGPARRFVLAAGAALAFALAAGPPAAAPGSGGPAMTLELRSSAFEQGGEIPRRYTCEGEDISPPLAWEGEPAGTRSFALVVEDPDAPDPRAPRMTWVHWIVVDIPPSVHALPEGAGAGDGAGALPGGARHGLNDWKRADYGGPCPPVGRHRYFHRLYALDRSLEDLASPTRSELTRAMQGHVLAQAELVGTYERQAR